MNFDSMRLSRTAKMAVEEVAAVKAGENVCIVADTDTLVYAEALANASSALGADTVVCIMAPRKVDGEEPPAMIGAAMRSCDVALLISTYTVSHTDAMVGAAKAGVRMVVFHEMGEDVFTSEAMTPDYAKLDEDTRKLAELLTRASKVRVVTSLGTDISLSLAGRQALSISGAKAAPITGLPGGEAAIAPVEGTAEGIVVVDHAVAGIGKLQAPIKVTVKKGRAVSFEGGAEAAKLRDKIAAADGNANNIAEFAIGTNPKSRLLGNVPEDKKKRGSIHIALGDNHAIGGTVSSGLHLDMIILRPTVWLDGNEVVTQGELQPLA